MTARWSTRANANVREIGRYIARDKPKAARAWINRVKKTALDASKSPMLGRMVPEYGRSDVREVFLRSYRIVWRVVDDGIWVLSVSHGHMLLRGVDPDAE
jgi:plasmid stabilization system protein ParE